MATLGVTVKSDFDQASKDLKEFTAESESTAKSLKKFQESFKTEQVNKFLDRQKLASTAIRATRGEIEANKVEFRALQREIERLIKRGIDPQSESVKKLTSRYDQLQKEIKETDEAQKKNVKTSQSVVSSLASVAAGWASVQAASAFIKQSAQDFIDYSKSIANVNTLLDITDKEAKDLDKSLTDISGEFAVQKKELSAGVYQALSAGAEDLGAALDIVKASTKLATGALIENEQAVDIVTTAINAYGPEVITATEATDKFFTIVKQGKITGEQLSATIGQSISLFAAAKIPIDELGAGIATLTKVGVPASEATTQLNAIVNAFLKPSEALAENLEKFGFASGSALLEAEGLGGALEFLQDATGGNLDQLSKLLPNVRGLRGALAAGSKDGKVFADVLKEFESAAGAADTAARRQTDGFAKQAFQLKQAQIELENIRIEIGSKLVPIFSEFLSVARVGLPLVSSAIDAISVSLGAITTAVKVFLSPLIQGVQGAIEALDILKTQGVDGLGEAFKRLSQIPSDIFKNIGDEINGFIGIISNAFFSITERFGITQSDFEEILLNIKSFFTDAAESIQTGFIVAFNSISIAALEFGQFLFDNVITQVQNLLELFGQIPGIGEKFIEATALVNEFSENVNNNIDKLKEQSDAAIAAATFEKNLAKEALKVKKELIAEERNILEKSYKEREKGLKKFYTNKDKADKKASSEAIINSVLTADEIRRIELKGYETRLTIQKQFADQTSILARNIVNILKNVGAETRAAAIAEKAINFARAVINTALAVTKTLAEVRPPANIPLAIAVGAAGAASAVKIATTPIPSAQTGTSPEGLDIRSNRRTGQDNVGVMVSDGERVNVTPRGEDVPQEKSISIKIGEETIFDVVQRGIDGGNINITSDNVQGLVIA